ncbi:putative O-methyltransferase YrrM [Actinocorallia herbida]|uniref:Putative O-methyltransferase YrrM n=1 Tax=Actinocorallia herbida TaxID=58109 RepID=A0A3N1CPJ2_9ACTN|nr:O-methyltransferase [Actinocorallia herbida]ROO83084.1 putative O-methyltransferase YrrM [Actinocorallia herbida]
MEAAINEVQTYGEWLSPEDEPLREARRLSEEFSADPIGPGGGAALRLLASLVNARTVVEIGSGCGVSGIWLLRGMHPQGVLTSVDVEPENQRLAKIAYTDAGFAAGRTRMISGRALDVLPRLTDAAYDLVFCDAVRREYPDYLAAAQRLLRPGGVVVFDDALRPCTDPADALGVETTARLIAEDESLIPLLLPIGDGLLIAQKHRG